MLSKCEVCAYAPVSDIERGREFYQRVLQLPAVDENDGGILFQCAKGSKFFMYLSQGAGSSKASTMFWNVEDIESEVAELKSRGVRFERYDIPGARREGDVFETGGVKNAWFKDPDGNILALIQYA